MNRNSVLIIPALNPDESLVQYVTGLIENGFKRIILVDDGSREEVKDIFTQIQLFPECEVLTHTVNMGKGRALKNAFNYYCQRYQKDYQGVITVDSDGQHTLADVIKIDNEMIINAEKLILGVRDFSDSSVPIKSKFGNKLTRFVMKMLWGNGGIISDTQTGLRGIPNKLLPKFLTLFGERFEYETTMLIEVINQHIPIQEIPIQTIYINENRETHFRPVKDSVAIYRLIFSMFFKYTIVSLSSFLIDYAIFCFIIFFLGHMTLAVRIWLAAVIARFFSSLYNYLANRVVVFGNKGKNTLLKYYTLCIVQLGCSAFLVWLICMKAGASEAFVKPIIDIILFFISYQIQRNWIFRGGLSCG